MGRPKKQKDFFQHLMEQGDMMISGLDKDFNSYKVIKLNDIKFRLTLKKEIERLKK